MVISSRLKAFADSKQCSAENLIKCLFAIFNSNAFRAFSAGTEGRCADTVCLPNFSGIILYGIFMQYSTPIPLVPPPHPLPLPLLRFSLLNRNVSRIFTSQLEVAARSLRPKKKLNYKIKSEIVS